MGEVSNTLEQRNTSQANTISKQAEQIKELKQHLADLSIWKRFVEYLVTDCNMQPDVLEHQMGEMLAAEDLAKKTQPKRKPAASSFTEPTYRTTLEVGITEDGWYFFDMIKGQKYGPFKSAELAIKGIQSVVNTPAS